MLQEAKVFVSYFDEAVPAMSEKELHAYRERISKEKEKKKDLIAVSVRNRMRKDVVLA